MSKNDQIDQAIAYAKRIMDKMYPGYVDHESVLLAVSIIAAADMISKAIYHAKEM
jgi:hypothetical protein